MKYYIESTLNLITFLLPVLLGIRQQKYLDKSAKIFLLFTVSSFITELTAFLSVLLFRTNLPVYNTWNIINFLILICYFRFQISGLKVRWLFPTLLIASFLIWLATILLIHSIDSVNSSFLGYQGLITISLSIYSMEHIVLGQSKDVFNLRHSPHFWIAFLLLAYWCISIMQWIMYRFFTQATEGFEYLDLSLTLINMITNLCYAAIFLHFPKMTKPNAL